MQGIVLKRGEEVAIMITIRAAQDETMRYSGYTLEIDRVRVLHGQQADTVRDFNAILAGQAHLNHGLPYLN